MPDDAELLHEWLDSFFEFFEWVYELELKEGARARVELELKRGWSNSDDSEIAFFARVLRAQDKVKAAAGKDEATMRAKARENLKGEFADTALTDKCRVLASLHGVFESARPECTGVAPAKHLGRTESHRTERDYSPVRKTSDDAREVVRLKELTRKLLSEVDITARRPDKTPIPATPSLFGLDSSMKAQALAEYWDNVQRVHIMNGDNFEAQRAMQNHQNYMNMMLYMDNSKNQSIRKALDWK